MSAFSICPVSERNSNGGTGIDNGCIDTARHLGLRLPNGIVCGSIGSRHLGVRSLPHGRRLTGSPPSRRGDLGVGSARTLGHLAAELLRSLFCGLACGGALSGPLLSPRVRCGRTLARCHDHGFGIGADLFELGAQLLRSLFGGLARGRALSSPLLSACLRCRRPLAR